MTDERTNVTPDEPDGGVAGGGRSGSSSRAAQVGRFLGPILAITALFLTHPSFAALGGLSADASWTLAVLALMATWW
jgi:hypothetical protein